MTAACSRAWQAEAALDGRLSRADTESFQRHAATCDCCAGELRSLETLRSVGQRLPILTSTPLEQRRLRQAVLRAANELAIHPRRAPLKRAFALGAFAVLALGLLIFWGPALREGDPALGGAAPTFQIETSAGAAWTSLSRQATVRLRLQDGWFELSVDKLRTGQRFMLELPDGELEVKGTRFIVEVHDAKTARVRVYEGRVALRLRGQPALLLEAGDAWPSVARAQTSEASTPLLKPPAEAPAPTAGPDEFVVAPDASALPTVSNRARARGPEALPALPSQPSGRVPQASLTDPAPPAGDAFAQAMAAFTAGDFGKAERLFTAFERAHPADARVEDATFLRAVARARRGDVAAAQAIARDYLRRYPHGLRRAEALRLLR